MLILALETATRAGSVALVGPGCRHAQFGDATRTHGVRLPEELLAFAAHHGYSIDDVDRLCVVSGPGSFTGLRVGLATIQGVAMTSGKLVIPVPTLDAMAAAWTEENTAAGVILVTCLDGARGDVFFAVFDVANEPAAAPRAIVEATVATPAAAGARIAALNEANDLVVVGDGAARYRDRLGEALPNAAFETSPLNLAFGAALLAAKWAGEAVAPHALRPLYVRRPDAVLARERARSMTDVTFAPASAPEDLNAIAELQRRSFANAWGADSLRWEFDNSKVARMYVGKTPAGALIAYCVCWAVFDELHINSIAVEPAWRRRGVARRFLEYVLAEAATGGARNATLEVRQSNDAARRLYEGLGFRVEGVRRDYYQEPREDAVILWHRGLAGRFGRGGR